MHVLALDTTTAAGSVALVNDDRVIVERSGDASRTHAERLPREIVAALDAAGARFGDVDVFAVACGPGSFTGLRIGIATIQGLAFVTNRPVVAVSALDALAHVAAVDRDRGAVIAAWMDAHRREVFSALYRIGSGAPFDPERLEMIDDAAVGDPASTIDRWTHANAATQPSIFIGDGAMLYASAIRERAPAAAIVDPPPLAGAIGRIAAGLARRGATTGPGGIRPLYVRRPDAELAREKKDAAYEEQRQR